jgi:hypothetical protein
VVQYIQGGVGSYTDTETLDDLLVRYQQSSSQSFGAMQKVFVVGETITPTHHVATFVGVNHRKVGVWVIGLGFGQ